jgi:16S rRNA (uracil1498-N3)-methyltransferase
VELRLSAAHVIVEAGELDLDGGPTLDPDDAHHLARVLRLKPGEAVTATDGAGRWRSYRWRGPDRPPEPDGEVQALPPPSPMVTVAFAPVKGDRPEWTAQKLTELGVDRIIPLRADRSVVRWEGERGAQQVRRLRRVVREAAMQSRRCHVPVVSDVLPTEAVPGALAHFDGDPVSLDHPVVLVGPEGGWSDAELESGRPRITLGPLVLRAETAALAAAVLLGSLRDRTILTVRGRVG